MTSLLHADKATYIHHLKTMKKKQKNNIKSSDKNDDKNDTLESLVIWLLFLKQHLQAFKITSANHIQVISSTHLKYHMTWKPYGQPSLNCHSLIIVGWIIAMNTVHSSWINSRTHSSSPTPYCLFNARCAYIRNYDGGFRRDPN